MTEDAVSRQAVIDAIITLWADKPFGNPALIEIKECVERVPPVNPQEPCEDAVSKQAVAEVLFKYVHPGDDVGKRFVEFLVNQINALPPVTLQLCEDAISRQAVIDMTGLSEWFDSSDSYNEFVIALSDLPPVNPQKPVCCPSMGIDCENCPAYEPKTGHWIDITNKHGTVIAVRCSCCEKSPKHAIKSDFCPNCGVKMGVKANDR